MRRVPYSILIFFLSLQVTQAESKEKENFISKNNVIIELNHSDLRASGSTLNHIGRKPTFPFLSILYGDENRYREAFLSYYLQRSPSYSGDASRMSVQFAVRSYLSLGVVLDQTVYTIHNTVKAAEFPISRDDEETLLLGAVLNRQFGRLFTPYYRSYAVIPAEVKMKPLQSLAFITTIHISPILGGFTAFRCCENAGIDPYISLEIGSGKMNGNSLARMDFGYGLRAFPASGLFVQVEGFYRTGYQVISKQSAASSSSSSDSSDSSSSGGSSTLVTGRSLQAAGIRFGAGMIL